MTDHQLVTPDGRTLAVLERGPATPVLLRHGSQDRFVPFGHGEWLARHLPGVQAELTEDDGQLTLTERHLDQVHAWLLERLG